MVSPRGCGGALLYVVVTDSPGHPSEGIEEWVVKVPMKTGLMASCKTNNYLLNALTAMESQVIAPSCEVCRKTRTHAFARLPGQRSTRQELS